MEVREQSKIVELWLTREERDDPAFRESLKPIYQQYKDQKYLVAVFLSGDPGPAALQPPAAGGEGGPGGEAGRTGDGFVKKWGGGKPPPRFFAFPLAISEKFIYNVI